ncbi:hypothetical protein P692DRAFT_201801834 [Suillus brevipes Sb2]|nr:hypothetical protein P692DRAFT_201801834 [Suillus brevipes Sb2]
MLQRSPADWHSLSALTAIDTVKVAMAARTTRNERCIDVICEMRYVISKINLEAGTCGAINHTTPMGKSVAAMSTSSTTRLAFNAKAEAGRSPQLNYKAAASYGSRSLSNNLNGEDGLEGEMH